LAELGVVSRLMMPAARPVTPVEIGSPVALVSVTAEGMPRLGVTKTGFVAKTAAPVPVSSESKFAKEAEVALPAAVVSVPVALVPTTEFGAKELANDEQVGQVMLPAASSEITPEALTATVPLAFGKVMIRAAVGSVMPKVVLLASTVAPSKTRGDAPRMLAAERVTLPEAVSVVKAPVLAVVAPIAVELMPVAVVLKLEEVMVSALAPVLMLEAPRPERARAPEMAVMFRAPVVSVRPFEAVRV
jgi:hypothetical protein